MQRSGDHMVCVEGGGEGGINDSQKQADGSSVRQTVPLIRMDLVRETKQATQQAQKEEEQGDQDCYAESSEGPVPEQQPCWSGIACVFLWGRVPFAYCFMLHEVKQTTHLLTSLDTYSQR